MTADIVTKPNVSKLDSKTDLGTNLTRTPLNHHHSISAEEKEGGGEYMNQLTLCMTHVATV